MSENRRGRRPHACPPRPHQAPGTGQVVREVVGARFAGTRYAWGLMLPLSYLLGHVLGYEVVGAWSAATLYVILYGVTMWGRFQRGAWERISIFAAGEGQSVSAG